MPVFLGSVYRGAFDRIAARVRDLATTDPAALATPVPACPGWTVHGVVSHVSGLAVDVLAGRLSGVPDDTWTAGQVDERRETPVQLIVEEWAPQVDRIATELDARRMPVSLVADLLTHEGDIAEALGDPMPPEDAWRDTARLVCRGTITHIDRAGTVTVRCAQDVWVGGAGVGGAGGEGPVANVDVPPWELFRGVLSRRSAGQMRSWAWDGDPEPWLEPLCTFGLRHDDQPRCAARS